MIVTNIIGGLGNQMFQYAAGRRAALKSGCDLGLDLTSMAGYGLRTFGLDQFALGDGVHRDVDGVAFSRGRGLTGRVRRTLFGDRDVREASFRFDPRVLEVRPPARLVGYWQSEKYFEDVADRIRADFALARPMADGRRPILERIQSSLSVSVHVRRGDYVTDAATAAVHGSCTLDWYARAVTVAAEGFADPVFFVFSDDPDWVRANLALPGRIEVIDPQSDGRDAEDMHLMAACRSHVIANSTFSWWAAWLDPRPGKRIVAPATWFASAAHDTTDLVPSGWLRV